MRRILSTIGFGNRQFDNFKKSSVMVRENSKPFKMLLLSEPGFRCLSSVEELNSTNRLLSSEYKNEDLENYGFSQADIDVIFKNMPQIQKTPSSDLQKSLEGWMQCQFGEERLKNLLVRNPELLLAPSKNIVDRYVDLASLFTKSYAYKVLLYSPRVIFEKWHVVEEKINFLTEEMKIPKSEVVNSGALSFPIDFLKERISFLTKVGVFKVPKKKIPITENMKNPSLDQIVNTTEMVFATKLAKVSLFEYEVFQQIYKDDDSDIR